MKHVDFKYIKLKHFLSIGEESVNIDFKPGISIITGKNKDKVDRRNGIGKSTIADGINFALFGETIRDIPKNNIVNNITHGKTYVELKFTVSENNDITEYTIIRTLKPTKCILLINGEDKTESTIPNTNNLIRSIVHASPELFQNCVIMSLNTTLPFMAQKKVEKRKFIEGILKLEMFSQMLLVARSQYTDTIKNFDIATRELSHQKNYKDITTKQISDKQNEKEIRIKQYRDYIDKLIDKCDKLEKEIVEPDLELIANIRNKLELILEKCNEYDKTIQEYRSRKIQYQTEIKYISETLKKIGTDKEKCPTCLNDITDKQRETIENEKSQLTIDINNRKRDITDINSQIDRLVKQKDEYNKTHNTCKQYLTNSLHVIDKNNNIRKNIDDYKKEIRETEESISEITSDEESINKLKIDLKTYSNKVNDLQIQVNKLSHESRVLEYVKYVLSEEGVKSFIVKKILDILNSRMHHYLTKMDSNCVCVFNELFEEEITNEKGQSCSYFNFSGAERKTIDLACLFTFMDIRRMQGDVSYNIVIFDELLDTSLDEKGVELVLSILRERVENYNEGVYIMSHRKESMKEYTAEIIELEKSNGITTRVNVNLEK